MKGAGGNGTVSSRGIFEGREEETKLSHSVQIVSINENKISRMSPVVPSASDAVIPSREAIGREIVVPSSLQEEIQALGASLNGMICYPPIFLLCQSLECVKGQTIE